MKEKKEEKWKAKKKSRRFYFLFSFHNAQRGNSTMIWIERTFNCIFFIPTEDWKQKSNEKSEIKEENEKE